ncbi:MAG: class I SAM-dependent methyltransferase [Actinomycetota bacterium]
MLDDHVSINRAVWDEDAPNWVESGRRAWGTESPSWGIWGVPETELQLLPDVSGLDVVELGCGTGYVSAWLARRGGRCVGLDNSSQQLATARMLQREFGLAFPLVHADAERAPFADGSFDVAISEYGAAIWCDPHRWIPEAARLLRPGGRLVFLGHSNLVMLCMQESETEAAGPELLRDLFGMRRFEWPGEAEVEFAIPHGEMVRLLRGSGFEIEDLVEIRAPEGATTPYGWVSSEWARRWPSEEAWKARKVR